jgi:hypothetical protein
VVEFQSVPHARHVRGRVEALPTIPTCKSATLGIKDYSADQIQSLSILYDSLWWWRAEFGGAGSNPFLENDRGVTEPSAHTIGNAAISTTIEHIPNLSPLAVQASNASIEGMLDALPDMADWQLMRMTDWDWQELLGS